MLKNRILRCSSFRYVCKLVCIAGGVAVLALAVGEKLPAALPVYWVASPLLLLWLLDTGLAAERDRWVDSLRKNSGKEEIPLGESGEVSVGVFFRKLISLSIWPFYLILFTLIGFGGREIAGANKEAVEAAQKTAAVATPVVPHYPQGNVPPLPNRPTMSFNPATQRFTPLPFPTPPRFPPPNHPPVSPARAFVTPPAAPNSSPPAAAKGL